MKPLLFIILFSSIWFSAIQGQYSWDWHDPNDLKHIDLGDNKVILYNAIGLGLTYLFSKSKGENVNQKFQSITTEYNHEYIRPPLSDMYSIKYRNGTKIRQWIWAGLEISATLNPNNEKEVGLGVSPFFSWNIINRSSFRLSYDNGLGPILFSNMLPEGGTRFNFYTFYGLDLEISANELSYSLGFRNTHISNAFIAGRDRNPSYDGLGGYIRVRFLGVC